MRIVSSGISIHSSDTAGVASALYELGGLIVIHDASGCNSTYATHDEPRWYDGSGMVYISGLTEMEAVMGDDESFIRKTVEAARALGNCRFIALCGSPMPMMTGTDFDALAAEIERAVRLPVIPLHTNGIRSYLSGASEAFTALAERFCARNCAKRRGRVNILGATPLDFSVNGQTEAVSRFLEEAGFAVNSCWAMGSSLDELARAGEAAVNLVVSSSALALAEVFRERFDTPYVTAVPVGRAFARRVKDALEKAARSGESDLLCLGCRTPKSSGACVIGESLWSSSLACALESRGVPCRVLNPLEGAFALMKEGDLTVPDEEAVAAAFAGASAVYGDPLYKPAAPAGVPFIPVPHEAFSGRCFRKSMKNLICDNFEKELELC